jgi:hypothetical protein
MCYWGVSSYHMESGTTNGRMMTTITVDQVFLKRWFTWWSAAVLEEKALQEMHQTLNK